MALNTVRQVMHHEESYRQMIEHFEEYTDVADHPLNGSTTVFGAFALTVTSFYDHVVDYVDAWCVKLAAVCEQPQLLSACTKCQDLLLQILSS